MKNIKQLLLAGCWLLAVQAVWAQHPNCTTVSTENALTGETFLNYGSASDALNTDYRSSSTIGQPLVGTYFGQDFNGGYGFWGRNYLSPIAPAVTASEGDLTDRIKISWQPDALSPAASEGYKVYRDGSLLATVGGATSSFIDFNVIAGVFYEYEVAGINSFGEGQRGSSLGFLNPNGVVTGQVKSSSGNPVPGAVVTLTPSLGAALEFDGVDDMAFVEYNPQFPRNPFTLSCWVKLEGTNDNTGIFDMGSSIGKNWWLHTLPSASGKGIRFGIGHGGATEMDHPFPAGTEDDWHFIAATYNGSSLLLYADGNLIGTTVATIQSDSIPLFFGRKSGGTDYFKGKLDEVRFFDRQVSQSELQMFTNRTVAADAEGLVAYWKFDEGIGSKAFGQTAVKSTAYFCGSQWTSDRPEVINAGVTDETGFYEIAGINYGGGETFTAQPYKNFYFNQSLEFNAANEDYATLTDFDIEDTATITIALKTFDFGNGGKTILKKLGSNSIGNPTPIFKLSLNNGNLVTALGSLTHDFGPLDTGFHCIALKFIHNGNNITIDLYKDGVNLGSHAQSILNHNWEGSFPWIIGADQNVNGNVHNFFTGLIDEVAFYNKSLDLSEIQEQANVGTNEAHPNLTHYFNLNEGSGTELHDMGSKLSGTGTIHGALWSTVAKGGIVSPHEFLPASRLVTLNPSSTSVDQIDFGDQSLITVSGFVRFEGTNCYKKGVEILVNGEPYSPPITTDEDGFFEASFEPGSTIKLSAFFSPLGNESEIPSPDSILHVFEPPFWELRNISTPVSGLLFRDQTKREVRVYLVGNEKCRLPIVEAGKKVMVKLATLGGCHTQFKEFGPNDTVYTFKNVPADSVTVAVIEDGTTVAAIFNYFDNNGGAQILDLNLKGDTLDFLYIVDPEVNITPLPTISCGMPGMETEYTVLKQSRRPGEHTSVDITVEEVYAGGACELDTALLGISNGIADFPEFPDTMTTGVYEYEFPVGVPNLGAAHKKKLEVVADVKGKLGYNFVEAIVEGERGREGQAIATTFPEIPLVVLHDPPGDASYAYWEKGQTYCTSIGIEIERADGEGEVHRVNLGPKFEIGAGFGLWTETEAEVIAEHTGEWIIETSVTGAETAEVCMTAQKTISTGGDDVIVGGEMGGDVYYGGAFNLLYGLTDSISFNTGTCEVDWDTSIIFQLNGFNTNFLYSEFAVLNTVIPSLETAESLATLQTTKDSLRSSIELWQDIVDRNQDLKDDLKIADENISFDAGATYEYSSTVDTTTENSWSFERTMDGAWAFQGGFYGAGVGGQAGFQFTVRKVDASSSGTTGVSSVTTGYVLADDDVGDIFSVDVFSDPYYQTPLFKLRGGNTSCPWEPNSVPRQTTLLNVDKTQAIDVPYNGAAVFNLTLTNDSQSNEDQFYTLGLAPESNAGGAIVKVNGAALIEFGYVIPAGVDQEVVLTVERNPNTNQFIYDDLEIALYSQCEKDRADGLAIPPNEFFYSVVLLDVTFKEPCSPVDISFPNQGWVIDDNTAQDIYLDEYNLSDPELLEIRAEYRRVQGDGAWIPIATVLKADLDAVPPTIVSWNDHQLLSDGLYEIRAITQCSGFQADNPGISHFIQGSIDRTAPEVFAFQPADQVLSTGDEISITFTEPINCDSVFRAVQVNPSTIDPGNIGLYNSQSGDLIGIDFVCSGDKIVILPTDGSQFFENTILRAEVHDIQDFKGNKLANYEWEFFSDQNPLHWSVTKIEDTKYEDEAKTLYREITNEGGSARLYEIHGSLPDPITGAADPIPNWVNVFPLEGLLAPGEQQIITFEFDETMAIGMYADTFYMSGPGGDEPIIIDFRVLCRPPEWEISPASYDYSMNFTVQLDIEGDLSTDNQDIVGAFVDGELRGFAHVQYVATLDLYEAFLNVYSNNFTGETVDFRIWDASACHLYGDIIETYTFTGDELVGSPNVPVTLHTSGQLLRSILLHEGWNWISFNLEFLNDSLDHALASLDHPENDLIKNQTAFANYTGAPINGWLGSLDTLNHTSLFQFQADLPDTIDMTGLPIDALTTDIPIVSGWNWTGYLPQSPLTVDAALGSLSPLNGDVIKGQASFAQYVSGLGWIGSLEYMQAPEGYLLKMTNAGTLTYPQNFDDTPVENRTVTSDPRSPWSVHAPDFEHSMTIVGMLSDGMGNVTLEGQTIGAFVGGEARGVATATYIEALDERLFFLTIFANEAQEELTFKLYDENTDEVTDLQEELFFDINLQVGNPLQPMPFTQLVNSVAETDASNGRLVVMPNPFKSLTSVHYQSVENGTAQVSITDALGRVVDDFEMNALRGWNRFEWMAEGLTGGVYFIKIEMRNVMMMERVVLER